MLAALFLLSAVVTQPLPSPMSPSPSARADHLALHVADLDRSVAFYTRYFGLQPMQAAARISTIRWLQAGSFELHLIGGRTKPVQVPIDAKHFRNRAIDCRALAKSTRNRIDAGMLEEIAEELDEEARRIESGNR